MASSESVTIPIDIPVDTSSVETAKGKLREAESALRMLKEGAKVPTYFEFQTDEAKAAVKSLTAEVKALEKANKDAAKSAEALAKEGAKARDKANDLAVKGFQFQRANEKESAEKAAASYDKASDALQTGAGFVVGAAAAITASAASLLIAGTKFGIEQTAQREKNTRILDRLTKGQGAEAEEFSKKLAGDTGVTEDKAMERVKGLIQAKFNKEQTGAVFKAAADIGEVKGEGKAELFIKTLEKVQFAGSASEKSVKALLGAGVERSELLEGLKQVGETTEQVEARLKKGKVTAEEFSKAATAAVEKDIGGVAGKGLDATLNRIKIAADDLFDDLDLGPIEEVGAKLQEVLSGEEGKELKKAITEAGDAVIGLVKNVSKDDIKLAFITGAEGARELAKAVKEVSGAVGALAEYSPVLALLRGGGLGEKVNVGKSRGFEDESGKGLDHSAAPTGVSKDALDDLAAGATAGAANPKTEEAAKGGNETGKAYAEGLARGVEENADKPAAAVAGMVKGMIAAGKDTAKEHSPSKVAEESGKNYDAGWEKGITGDADKPARAAAEMAGRTTRAGQGGAAFGGSTGASGGGDVTITIGPFNLPPGSNEATKEAVRAGLATMLPELLSALRTVNRIGGVTGGPSLP